MELSDETGVGWFDRERTFALSDLLPGTRSLPGRWLYKWKVNKHNEVVRAKSYSVIKSFVQEKEVDYFDTYAPTPSASSIR